MSPCACTLSAPLFLEACTRRVEVTASDSALQCRLELRNAENHIDRLERGIADLRNDDGRDECDHSSVAPTRCAPGSQPTPQYAPPALSTIAADPPAVPSPAAAADPPLRNTRIISSTGTVIDLLA